jgi:hypothetical protein
VYGCNGMCETVRVLGVTTRFALIGPMSPIYSTISGPNRSRPASIPTIGPPGSWILAPGSLLITALLITDHFPALPPEDPGKHERRNNGGVRFDDILGGF